MIFLGVPVLNAFTTSVHLGATLPSGDWVLAGFDLTALATGMLAALAGIVLHRHSWSRRAQAWRTTVAATGESGAPAG